MTNEGVWFVGGQRRLIFAARANKCILSGPSGQLGIAATGFEAGRRAEKGSRCTS